MSTNRLQVNVPVTDGANPESPPLTMRVMAYGWGVSLIALRDDGSQMTCISLDYHDNRLAILVDNEDEDAEPDISVVTSDVATERTKKGEPDESGTDGDGGASQ